MQLRLDRKNANELDVARLCEEIIHLKPFNSEEIINPEPPMAQKWREKRVMEERTLLPNEIENANNESITLPANEETSLGFTNAGEPEEEISTRFNNMQLGQAVDDYIAINLTEDNIANDHHQVDYNDITLTDPVQPSTSIQDRFERFEEGDDLTQLDEHLEMPPTHIPSPVLSPVPQAEPQAGGSKEHTPENHLRQQSKRNREARVSINDIFQQRQGLGSIIDWEGLVLPNAVWKSWLTNASDLIRKRAKWKSTSTGSIKFYTRNQYSLKMAKLMELPSTVLMDDMFMKGYKEIPYPAPLLDLWKKGNRPHDVLHSVRNSPPQPQPQPHFVSSGNSGDEVRSTSSSVSGDGVPSDNEYMAPDPDFIGVTQLTNETPADDPPPNTMTENIKGRLKSHFERPEAPQVEFLQNLVAGLTRKEAARLFYEILELASQGFLRVRQEEPLGEIFITKGDKM